MLCVPGFYGSVLTEGRACQKRQNRSVLMHPFMHPPWKRDVSTRFDRFSNSYVNLFEDSADLQVVQGTAGIRDLVPEIDRFLPRKASDVINRHYGHRYFGPIIDEFRDLGVFVEGLPYDFRKITNGDHMKTMHLDFVRKLTWLNTLNQGPTVIVAHSLGAVLTHYFLTIMTDNWKDAHVEAVVFINPPFGGVPAAYKAMLDGVEYFPHTAEYYAEVIRNFSGFAMSLPNSNAYSPNEVFCSIGDVLVRGPRDIDPGFDAPYEDIGKIIQSIQKPTNVETHIIIDDSSETPVKWELKNGVLLPSVFEKGDGLVPSLSHLCYPHDAFVHRIPNAKHTLILQSHKLADYIKNILN